MRTVTIGRDPSCDIVVNDPYASPQHCIIEMPVGYRLWRVRDLGSTNGTFVLSQLSAWEVPLPVIGWKWLRSGDVLVIGRTRMPPFTPERVTG
jgi:pSer/pThr/pTyr-binding forkhead associated (FHA) protein